MIGINVDALTGPMIIRENQVRSSGGRYHSDCGIKNWPAVNIGPGSEKLIRGDPSDSDEGAAATQGCLLAREDR
jgi:hypothetical protein